MFFNDFQKALTILRVFDGTVAKGLHKSLNSRDWCPDFMRNVSHKITPDILEPPKACYIVKNDKRTDSMFISISKDRAVSINNPLNIRLEKDRVFLGGHAVTVSSGELHV